MAKRWNRVEVVVGLIVLGIGGVLMGVAGLFVYRSATATPLHPDAQQMSSVPQAGSPQQWARAIERARQAMRASVAEQNLPGLSVAVAIDGSRARQSANCGSQPGVGRASLARIATPCLTSTVV